MTEQASIIKTKIDESVSECIDLISKKAIDAGIKDGTRSMWLFHNRTRSILYASIVGALYHHAAKEQLENIEEKITND